ncbi:MAG: hypothetical protein GXY54_08120 [Deltaproteobacteria bacterium]|nr:hypothetical protein [Deltaproteobacteria bacterium]
MTIARNRTAELAKKEAAKKEAKQKQAAEAARQAEEQQRRAALSPLDRSILEVIEADPDPKKKDWTKLFTELKKGKWQGEEARLVAEKIKAGMITSGKWKENTKKKNPSGDHEYQDTLQVLKFLKN